MVRGIPRVKCKSMGCCYISGMIPVSSTVVLNSVCIFCSAEECLKREKDRVSHYLHSSSETKLLEKVQHELLSVYATQLLEKEHSGCHALLRDDKPVANIFKQHVTAEGTAVKQAEDAASNKKAEKKDVIGLQEQLFVRKVIELHDEFMAYVNDCFLNHPLFHKAPEEAFEIFCNKGVAGSSTAELLTKFGDNILKKGGSEKLSDEAIEETLEKAVKLLAYISDKDLFAELSRKKLARRLLFDKSANDEHERYPDKVEATVWWSIYIKNGGNARENQTSFEEYLSNNQNASPVIDLTVTVLTTGFWPSYKSFDLNLPAEMVKCVEVFREFYQTKTKHRKITWICSLGCLIPFHAPNIRFLIKSQKPKQFLRRMFLNSTPKFTDKMRRIKIPLPPIDEKRKVIEVVDKDRRYAIDASIVRIMKSRKVLEYQQLVMECVEQLGRMFKPDVKAIKKRVEDLITRDYLERDKDNPNLFKYLA
ncbi:unnamed protein product [Fraxinus pennsylvanica]|uniref:Cullin family profile domain-containing protein n=1 Tax=Fraxinus pennsylvanica TaxID=56036 RepID=A0AAD2E3T7_9LAMI|nr:unnamed protein product [Fraxinus pennsylvanica]